MPAGRKVSWLICYDIANPRRLQRVHRAVASAAEPVQYSVFRKKGTRRDIVRLMAEIEPLANPKRDDIRAYSLLTSGHHAVYGLTSLPAGILLLD